MKCFGHSWTYIIYHKKPKNVKFSFRRSPKRKHASGGATSRAEKPVLWPKIQKWQNFLQIPWNLGWRSIIKYHAQPKKLRPRFTAYHVFCASLVPSWCMQFNGAITVLVIWAICVCLHGVESLCQVNVWPVWDGKLQFGVFSSDFQMCAKGKGLW